MATIDWPVSLAFRPAGVSLTLDVSEATATGFYTGNRTRRTNLADRLRMTVSLPPCLPGDGMQREAFVQRLRSGGDWVRMGIPLRTVPAGTARGTMVTYASASAGARAISVSGPAASSTLLGGDVLQVGTNTLLIVAYPGATFDGQGQASVPLALPLPVALSNGASVTWSGPKGLWELDADGIQVDYTAPALQAGFALPLRQVISS